MLQTIENLMHDHEALRGHMQLLRKSADKWRTILSPKGSADNPVYLELLTEKRKSFIQAIGYLKEGLTSLHVHEEAVILAVTDAPSLKSIKSAHTEIMQKLDKINVLLINLEPNLLRINGDYLTEAISDLCDLITEHSLIEDRILQLLRTRSDRVLQPV